MARPTITVYISAPGGESLEVELPAKRQMCTRCDGTGRHTNPSIDGNGITASEMEELGDDFREDYLSGVYDVTCGTCKGEKIIEVLDHAVCQRAPHRAIYRQHLKEQEDSARDDYSERFLRMAEAGERY